MARSDRRGLWSIVDSWSCRWWLDYRECLLALGFLCQFAGGHHCSAGVNLPDASSTSQSTTCFDRLPGRGSASHWNCPIVARFHLGRLTVRLALTSDHWHLRVRTGCADRLSHL